MSESGSDFISSQINYKQVNSFAPRYKYVKISMSNILSNSVPISATNTTQVSYKMPYNTVYNLAKSKLVSLIPVPAQAANVSRVTADAFPFGNQVVSFETGNGLQLLNLPEPAKYTKVVTKVNTSFKDYVSTDPADAPHICNQTTLANNQSPLGTASTTFVLEPEYYYTSAAATAKNIPIMYELGNFSHTILSQDRDVYFGQNDMYLKYTIGGYNTWCFAGSSATNPVTGAAGLDVAMTALQNCYLYLCVETNPLIIDNIVNEYNSKGLRLLIDYPFVTKTATGASQSQNIVIPFVPAQGKYFNLEYNSISVY